MVRHLTLLVVAAVLVLAGCGGDEEGGGVEPVPAAGALTPSGDEGVPPGAGYDLNANEWLELGDVDRFEATLEYIADNPAECRNGDGRFAAADPVRDYADATIGVDYPLAAPMSELLAEGCAAALQSGEQDLAEEQP